jgi:hypothetical protein
MRSRCQQLNTIIIGLHSQLLNRVFSIKYSKENWSKLKIQSKTSNPLLSDFFRCLIFLVIRIHKDVHCSIQLLNHFVNKKPQFYPLFLFSHKDLSTLRLVIIFVYSFFIVIIHFRFILFYIFKTKLIGFHRRLLHHQN